MKYESAENLLNNYSNLKEISDKQNAGVIVDFISNVNAELFIRILKESDRMTEAMKELVAPELISLRLIIENNKKELEHNKKELENNKKELENKDAEIAKLKQQLLEATKQYDKS